MSAVPLKEKDTSLIDTAGFWYKMLCHNLITLLWDGPHGMLLGSAARWFQGKKVFCLLETHLESLRPKKKKFCLYNGDVLECS